MVIDMIDEKAIRNKIKSIENELEYLKIGYDTLTNEIKQLKVEQWRDHLLLEEICKILGI